MKIKKIINRGGMNQLEQMAFSPSRLETLDCPFRFEKLYIEKRLESVGEMALIGRLFHDWIAEYTRLCKDRETNKLRDLSWIKILDAVSAEFDFQGFDQVKPKTFAMIQNLMDDPYWKLPIDNFDDLLNIERQWGFQIHVSDTGSEYLKPCGWFDSKIDLRMIADLIFRSGKTLHIVDHKTGWGEPWEHQLTWYAAGAYAMYFKESWGEICVWYHWPGKGGRYEQVGNYPREALPALTDQVIKQIREARKVSEFPAIQCRACSWCGFKAECPLMAESARGLITTSDQAVLIPKQGKFEIVDQGTAERALQAIVMVGARLKEVEDDLKKWVAELIM